MTLAPGIYKATVCGVPDQIVMLTEEDGTVDLWATMAYQKGPGSTRWFRHEHITNARLQILLDLEDPRDYAETLRQVGLHTEGVRLRNLAAQIEAQTKPPRIKEPGLWGVVEAGLSGYTTRRKFVSIDAPAGRVWLWVALNGSSSARYDWDALIDPTLIRAGLS